MIGGAQPKILVTQDADGNLHMDNEMAKLFFGDRGKNWKLVRERDGLTHYASKIRWIEWDEERRYRDDHEDFAVGRSLMLDPHRMSFTWLTTKVTEIIAATPNSDYIKFKTTNSTYELFRLYDAPTGNPV
jgi:hypothetical protein